MATKMAKMSTRRKSVAEARNDFAHLVHLVEEGPPVEITRRGRTVAMLLSSRAYELLTKGRRSPADVIREFRECVVREGIDLDDADFEGLRDRSPGRDVDLS